MKISFLLCTSALAVSLLASPAFAIGDILNPVVTEGQLEVEYKGLRTQDDSKSGNNKQGHTFEVEYGVNDWLGLAVGTKFERESGESLATSEYFTEAKFQLTDQNDDFWLNSAILTEYVFNQESGGADALETKILLSKKHNGFEHRLNLIGEKAVGDHADGTWELGSRYNVRYKLHPNFKPGFEWQAEYGEKGDIGGWDEQEHYVGPAAFGYIADFGEAGEFEYEAAYLFGISDAAKDGALRVKLEYEVQF